MPRYAELAQEIRSLAFREPIKVLVWGPGDPGNDAPADKIRAYNKRVQMKTELRSRFQFGEIYFSEDPEMDQIAAGIPEQLEREALQAYIADVVVMLDLSRGADLELDHFVPTYAWFRDKVHVFLPEQYVSPRGLAREVFGYLRPAQVEGYSHAEFEGCVVASAKTVNVVQNRAMAIRLKRGGF